MKAWTIAAVTILALAPLGMSAYATATEPVRLRALLLEEESPPGTRDKPASTEVWAFVPLGDCRIGAVHIDSLNRLHARSGTRVIGVLLDVPSDSAHAARVARSFGTAFPLVPDVGRRYANALAREGRTGGAIAVVERGEITALFAKSPEVLSIAALNQRTVAAGQDDALTALLAEGRKLMTGTLRLVRVIGNGVDAPLKRPELFTSAGDVLAVYDYGDNALKAFSTDGNPLWTYKDPTGRPRAFENPMDLRTTASGELMLLDIPSYRVSLIGTDGRLVRSFRLSRPVERLVPLQSGELLGLQTARAGMLGYRFDSAGRVLEEVPASSSLQRVPSMARTGYAASLPGSNSAVIAFAYSDHMSLAGAGGRVTEFRGIEPLTFPDTLSWKDAAGNTIIRISPSAVTGALGVDADTGHVYVLFGGRTKAGWRLIDVYRRNGETYEGTYMLPEAATSLRRTRDGFITLHGGPNPKISVWRIERR